MPDTIVSSEPYLRRRRPTRARCITLAVLVACFGPATTRIEAQDAGDPSTSPASGATQPSIDEPVLFETRSGFTPTPLDAPPIAARRASEETDALAVAAVGDVQGRTVADIGAGRGRYLSLR